MTTPPPYQFTWGTSGWQDGSVWSLPGIYKTAWSSQSSTATTVGVECLVSTGFDSVSVTDTQINLGADGAYVDPTGSSGVYVTPFTDRVYSSLPAFYRDDDAAQAAVPLSPDEYGSGGEYDVGFAYDQTAAYSSTYPLLRWLASLLDFSAGAISALVSRFASPTQSALTDPWLADEAWLPWLGQFVGVQLQTPIADVTAARARIAGAMTAAPAGSKEAMAATVQSVLTGAQTVTIQDHYQGNQWAIAVDTFNDQTPTVATGSPVVWGESTWGSADVWQPDDPIVRALEQADQKPAGFTIVHTISYGFVWGTDVWGGSHVWEAQPPAEA